MSGITSEHRFSGSRPCPVCRGHSGLPSGRGERCYGFISEEGEWAHCTREEHAGSLEPNPNSATYAHKLTGDCRCGERHDLEPADVVVPIRGARDRSKAPRRPREPLGRLTKTWVG